MEYPIASRHIDAESRKSSIGTPKTSVWSSCGGNGVNGSPCRIRQYCSNKIVATASESPRSRSVHQNNCITVRCRQRHAKVTNICVKDGVEPDSNKANVGRRNRHSVADSSRVIVRNTLVRPSCIDYRWCIEAPVYKLVHPCMMSLLCDHLSIAHRTKFRRRVGLCLSPC